MSTREVTVASTVGLHARPAAIFVRAATATGLPITIAKTGRAPVDARSLLMVMSMGANFGDTVTLSADGEGADAALDALVELLSRDLESE